QILAIIDPNGVRNLQADYEDRHSRLFQEKWQEYLLGKTDLREMPHDFQNLRNVLFDVSSSDSSGGSSSSASGSSTEDSSSSAAEGDVESSNPSEAEGGASSRNAGDGVNNNGLVVVAPSTSAGTTNAGPQDPASKVVSFEQGGGDQTLARTTSIPPAAPTNSNAKAYPSLPVLRKSDLKPITVCLSAFSKHTHLSDVDSFMRGKKANPADILAFNLKAEEPKILKKFEEMEETRRTEEMLFLKNRALEEEKERRETSTAAGTGNYRTNPQPGTSPSASGSAANERIMSGANTNGDVEDVG
ncbi:unnamed protein product, partial [Amoebophrya sp. A120]